MKLNPEDLSIEVFSNSIHAGDCAFRITHVPSGNVGSCDRDCPVHGDTYDIRDERRKCAMRKLQEITCPENERYIFDKMVYVKENSELSPDDIEIDIFIHHEGSGQSYLRIVHIPSGLVGSCDKNCIDHRGYHLKSVRKGCAMRKLRILIDLKEQE